MRTRSRFILLFLALGFAVMAIAVISIYRAVGMDSLRRLPAEAEALLGAASTRAVDGALDPGLRLDEATGALIEARALLAQGRVLEKDAVVGLALSVAAILGAVLAAASLAFIFLSRILARGIGELAAGVRAAQEDRNHRLKPSSDPDLDAVRRAVNELLDLAAEQERRLEDSARLEGWREVASFLAHQLKNPLAALLLAAENGSTALRGEGKVELARECLDIARVEGNRLRALIDRFRDLAPAGLEAYDRGGIVDLRLILEACSRRAEAMGARASLELGEGGEAAIVRGDRGLLEQAFWNLYANSIEAGSAAIQASLGLKGNKAILVLTDSSRGIDPALIARLGRERLTTKAGGTGLGLVLVRRILGSMGGSLELFPTTEGGLGARVVLPLERGSS